MVFLFVYLFFNSCLVTCPSIPLGRAGTTGNLGNSYCKKREGTWLARNVVTRPCARTGKVGRNDFPLSH